MRNETLSSAFPGFVWMGMGIIPTLILASLFFIFLEEQGPPQCISEQCPCFYFERLVTINQLNLSPSCLRFQCVIFYYIYTSTRQAAGAAVWSFSHMNSGARCRTRSGFFPSWASSHKAQQESKMPLWKYNFCKSESRRRQNRRPCGLCMSKPAR